MKKIFENVTKKKVFMPIILIILGVIIIIGAFGVPTNSRIFYLDMLSDWNYVDTRRLILCCDRDVIDSGVRINIRNWRDQGIVITVVYRGNVSRIVNYNNGDLQIIGTRYTDIITDQSTPDRVFSTTEVSPWFVLLSGNDYLRSLYSGFTAEGCEGDDEIHGSSGDDLILGGSGNDRIYGHAGNDTIISGVGDDFVNAGDGNDYIADDEEADEIVNSGENHLYGGPGNDVIYGGVRSDHLYGDTGEDRLHGNRGDDYLDGGGGLDILHGDRGADTFYLLNRFEIDRINDYNSAEGDRIDVRVRHAR